MSRREGIFSECLPTWSLFRPSNPCRELTQCLLQGLEGFPPVTNAQQLASTKSVSKGVWGGLKTSAESRFTPADMLGNACLSDDVFGWRFYHSKDALIPIPSLSSGNERVLSLRLIILATMTKILLAFDLYGTLLSTASIAKKLASHFGQEAADSIAATWRKYQLEYTWRLNSMSESAPATYIYSPR
jgi:hypothetical protein